MALLRNARHLDRDGTLTAEREAALTASKHQLAERLDAALAEAGAPALSDAALKAIVQAYEATGRPERAVAVLSAAIERADTANACWLLADVMRRTGDATAFEAGLRAHLEAVPGDRTTRRKLACLLALQGHAGAGAVEFLRAWGHEDPGFGRFGDFTRLMRHLSGMTIWEGLRVEDAVMLASLAGRAARPGGVFVEIGSWLGMSTSILGDVAAGAGAKVFAIDTWAGSESTWQEGRVRGRSLFDAFCANMEALGLLGSAVIPIVSRSDRCTELLAPGTVDLLFIDGDHRYAGVRADIAQWAPKVRPGGIICGHDCNRRYDTLSDGEKAMIEARLGDNYIDGIGHGGVIKAVHEAFGGRAESAGIGSSLWWVTVGG